MAVRIKKKLKSLVLLGYEDDSITETHSTLVGYWTNKIGGQPNWPEKCAPNPTCRLCSLPQLLVTQIYASLDDSPYHRTLFIFCCVNPNCWNLTQSWTCYRSQTLDRGGTSEDHNKESAVHVDWCVGSDDWGEGDDNGNALPLNTTDSDDSSSLTTSFGALNFDQCNANLQQRAFGAAGKISPTAEIEGAEDEAVSIDTPTAPQSDLFALLEATAPLPCLSSSTSFAPSFIWVCEEKSDCDSELDRKLLDDYISVHGDIAMRPVASYGSSNGGNAPDEDEKYERAVPLHGDNLIHQFISTVQANPGHVLRYSRGSLPLLMAPLDAPSKCSYCQEPLVFELQVLPTLLTKLRLPGDNETHLDFGNVLIYTCKNSCWREGDIFRVEHVCVQAELTHHSHRF